MRAIISIGIIFCVGWSNQTLMAQTPIRYLQPVFSEVQVNKGIVFGANINLQGNMQVLRLDCYQPKGDTLRRRPLLIWMHGGAFMMGNRADVKAQAIGNAFAKRGYVVASIDYRLGVSDSNSTTAFLEAMLRATQDGKAAIRFFRKNAAIYGVDTTHIFVAGSSAGGCTALLLAYWDQDEIPPACDQTRWGDLEGSSGHAGYSSVVHGVLNCWGGIADTNWIDPGEPPVAAYHGMKDRTVPYDVGYTSFGFPFNGSAAVCRAAERAGIYNELVLVPDMGHGVANEAQMDSLIHFASHFFYRLLTTPLPSLVTAHLEGKKEFALYQNHPNPFNAVTVIRYRLAESGHVCLGIYDRWGRKIVTLLNETKDAGEYIERFTFSPDIASGIYFCRLESAEETKVIKMALIR